MRFALPPSFRPLLPLLLCLVTLAGGPLRAQNDPRAVASSFISQGGKAYEAGKYDQAITFFQRSLDLFQRLEDARGVSASLTNLGLAHRAIGQDKKALEYYNRALDLADEADPQLSTLLGNTASLAISLGQFDLAIEYFNHCLELDRARGDRKGVAMTLDGLGQAYGRMRQFDRSLQYFTQSLEVIQPTGDLRAMARTMNNIGATGKAKGDLNLATRYLSQAVDLKRKFATRADLAGSLTNLALIYFDQGKLEPSAAAFSEAIIHHEVISREVREASKVGEYQDWFRSSLYRRYAHVLINQNKPEEALLALERGRSQGLARQAAQNRADYSRILGPNDARRLQATLAAFSAASAEVRETEGLAGLADSGGPSPLKQRLLEIRRRYDDTDRALTALRADLGARYPAYRRFSGSAPPSLAELKELAAKNPKTLYLEWAVGAESTSLLFALSQGEGVKSFVLEGGEDAIGKQVRAWRAAIEKRDVRETVSARALYTTLFGPVEKAGLLAPDKFTSLVLVGDGPLLEVPFAALVDGSGKRLIEREPVAVAGSLGVLTWPDDRAKPTASLLVAADPLSPGNPPLPAARAEGKSVAELFPGARLLVGAEATRRQVLPELGSYGILHFATHGMFDPEDGLSSGLLLATERGADDTQLLEARELINTRLSAHLAVLSACDTGQGERSGGEGLLGLTWAFRAAGCPATVASLWSVDDGATGQLMVRFYQGLKEGKPKDVALRDGMLAVKQAQPQPFFWAAFQVNGDTSAIKL
jgi:CHAT domain-containing protein/tetratricopeptide (TPR) repeat protein